MLQRSKKKSSNKKKVHPRVYTSIEQMPQHNWEQIVQFGRIEFIVIEKHRRGDELNQIIVRDAMDQLSDQFMEAMGINPQDDEYFVLIIKRMEARQKFMDGDRSAINFIRMFDKQIASIKMEAIKPNLQKYRLQVEKWFGPIDKYTKTVSEFIDIVKMMEEEAAQIRAAKNKKDTENG